MELARGMPPPVRISDEDVEHSVSDQSPGLLDAAAAVSQVTASSPFSPCPVTTKNMLSPLGWSCLHEMAS